MLDDCASTEARKLLAICKKAQGMSKSTPESFSLSHKSQAPEGWRLLTPATTKSIFIWMTLATESEEHFVLNINSYKGCNHEDTFPHHWGNQE